MMPTASSSCSLAQLGGRGSASRACEAAGGGTCASAFEDALLTAVADRLPSVCEAIKLMLSALNLSAAEIFGSSEKVLTAAAAGTFFIYPLRQHFVQTTCTLCHFFPDFFLCCSVVFE